jgi:hypothetical protein
MIYQMSGIADHLSGYETFAGLPSAISDAAKVFDPDAMLSREELSAVRGSLEPAVRAGHVFEAVFRPLLTPFTAELAWRPNNPKTISRDADVELDPEDIDKLNGPVIARFVLTAVVAGVVAGRSTYAARLVPPFPSQVPAEFVDQSRRLAEEDRQAFERRMAKAKEVSKGRFEVSIEELPEGRAVQVSSEGRSSKRSGRVALFVMSERDYDLVNPSGETFFRPTRDYETGRGIAWSQSPNYTVTAVNAMKRSDRFAKNRELIVLS